jgi:hypothetical protein
MKKTYIPPHIEVVTLEDEEVASMVNVCKTGDPSARLSVADECAEDVELTALDACLDDSFFQPCRTFGS